MQCFSGGCPLTWQYGILYAISNNIQIITSTLILKYVDATHISVMAALSVALTIMFWSIYGELPLINIIVDLVK